MSQTLAPFLEKEEYLGSYFSFDWPSLNISYLMAVMLEISLLASSWDGFFFFLSCECGCGTISDSRSDFHSPLEKVVSSESTSPTGGSDLSDCLCVCDVLLQRSARLVRDRSFF